MAAIQRQHSPARRRSTHDICGVSACQSAQGTHNMYLRRTVPQILVAPRAKLERALAFDVLTRGVAEGRGRPSACCTSWRSSRATDSAKDAPLESSTGAQVLCARSRSTCLSPECTRRLETGRRRRVRAAATGSGLPHCREYLPCVLMRAASLLKLHRYLTPSPTAIATSNNCGQRWAACH